MDPTLVLRPVLAALLVVALPGSLLAIARSVLAKRGEPVDDGDRNERWLLLRGAFAGGIALAVPLGTNALGFTHAWASPRSPLATIAVFLLIGLVALVMEQGRRSLGIVGRPTPFAALGLSKRLELGLSLVIGPALLLAAGRSLGEPADSSRASALYLAATLTVAHGLARWPIEGLPRPPTFSAPALLAITISAAPALLCVAAYRVTEIPLGAVTSTDADRAAARALLAPSDPHAALAQGWADAREGHLASAASRLAKAEALHADVVARLELETEIEAARGHCDAARLAFRRAVGIRAERSFERVLDERLRLGDYAIPPALVRRCGVTPASE